MSTTASRSRRTQPQLGKVAPDFADADYADAFDAPLAVGDDRSAEQLVRMGLEGAPALLRVLIVLIHRYVLGLRLGARSDPAYVLGWRITAATHDQVRLEATSPRMYAVMVAGRVDGPRASLTTALRFRRRAPARAIWAVIGPVHRLVAPLLLTRAARRP